MTSSSSGRHAREALTQLAARIISFGSLPILAALSPLVVLPLIARLSTQAEWASLLSAQLVGSFAAVLVTFGWDLRGQARVAMAASQEERHLIFVESLRSRLVLMAVIAPLACVISALISTPNARVTDVLMTLAMTSYGLSIGWYGVGTGQASLVARFEAVPRLIATALAASCIWLTSIVALYPSMLILATVSSLILFSRRQFRGLRAPNGNLRDLWVSLKSDSTSAYVSVLGSGYSSSAIPIASVMTLNGVAGFASIDRVYRYGLLALHALTSGTHAWSLDRGSSAPHIRQVAVLAVHLVVGLTGGLALMLTGPSVTALLFGRELAATGLVSAAIGALFFVECVSSSLVRNLLIPRGRGRAVAFATTAGAVVGLPSMIAGGIVAGSAGLAFGVLVGGLVSLVALVGPSVSTFSNLRTHGGIY